MPSPTPVSPYYPIPQPTSKLTSPQNFVAAQPTIVICGIADAERFAPALRTSFGVIVTSTAAEATALLARTPPALVVTRIGGDEGAGLALCVTAKRCAAPPSVLVTTTEPKCVPDALIAGCNAVLLEPFAPNL